MENTKKAVVAASDIIIRVRRCVGSSRYVFDDDDCDPPRTVNCFNLIWWVYMSCGITVPRGLKGLLDKGYIIHRESARPGDLIFVAQRREWHHVQDTYRAIRGVDHVGLLAESAEPGQRYPVVIHACAERKTVVEDPLSDFLNKYFFRCVCSIRPQST